jgi:ribosomal protein S6--L-glutamate ligase
LKKGGLRRRGDLRIGVVGLQSGWSTQALADAIESRTGSRFVVEIEHAVAELDRGSVTAGDLNLCDFDALIVKKIGADYGPDLLDRLELLRFVESQGVRVFSHPERILRMVDRVSCTTTLAANRIPMPPTVLTEDLDSARRAIERFGEAVLKPLYSTKARGFRLLRAQDDLAAELEAHRRRTGHPLFYIQKKVELSGRDLGVVFLGDRYLGTYARVAGSDAWDTTTHSGGHYEPFEPTAETVEIARRAADLFGLTLTSVDVALAAEGPMVFEVSAFGGFRGLREGLGIDGAALVAEHVVEQLRSAPRVGEAAS